MFASLFIYFFRYSFFGDKIKADSKPGSIIYPPRVVPKVEPNTNDAQTRNIWGQPSSVQQRISHPPPHCKNWSFAYEFRFVSSLE